ncbi:haloacid dehalogenase-like hydrolase [uncultured archaeon]|nr:haloacid dehalogenase-like hydrolase [uncultured archaeon]
MRDLEIFLDIDGCLINRNYDFTAPIEKIIALARKLESKARINLNSNRSLPSILKIWEKLKFNGLLIYENGLGVYNPLLEQGKSFDQPEFDREKLINNLSDIAGELEFIPTDDLVREPKNFISECSSKIYFEETRKFTLTAYPRLFKERVLFVDRAYLNRIKDRLELIYSEKYDIRTSESYGNIILVPKNASKSNPMKRIAQGLKIASFGDESVDICMFKESDTKLIGCPNNSQDQAREYVKNLSGFVSQHDYTLGVIDFLEYLNSYLGEKV